MGGLIIFYELTDWWITEFTEQECQYMCKRYQPLGSQHNTLSENRITFSSQLDTDFLNALATWFKSKKDYSIAERIYKKMNELGLVKRIL